MKEKGFTLIELLAVIVILAIIALIATPIVLNIINDSKNSSSIRSIEFYLKGLNYSVAQREAKNKKIKNGTYKVLKNGNLCLDSLENNDCIDELKIDLKGSKPKSGSISIVNLKVKEIINIEYNNKYYTKIGDNNIVENDEFMDLPFPPNLEGGLIPVIYDGDNWVIADVTEKWYDYKNQEWANAVLLKNSIEKNVGDIVTVDGEDPDVLAMFVWIPRYEYKIEGTYGKGGTSATSPGEIEINFISKYQTVPNSGYKIPPAFWWDNNDNVNDFNEQLSGFWIGKFEPYHESCSGEISVAYGCVKCGDTNCNLSDGVRILPNKFALDNNAIGSVFYLFRSMSKEGNVFGLDSNIVDTHLIKNSEWAAVSYLTQSKYGKYGNDDYTGKEKEVYTNNSSSTYTGRSGGSYSGNTPVKAVYADQTTTSHNNSTGFYTYDGYLLEYNTNNKTETRDMNKVASTTGNIYGVYDMSGGNTEYVMGYYTEVESSGMSKIDSKYLHRYSSLVGNYDGHGLSETAGWYNDNKGEFTTSYIYMSRGGSSAHISYSGIFGLEVGNGSGHGNVGSRVALITIE